MLIIQSSSRIISAKHLTWFKLVLGLVIPSTSRYYGDLTERSALPQKASLARWVMVIRLFLWSQFGEIYCIFQICAYKTIRILYIYIHMYMYMYMYIYIRVIEIYYEICIYAHSCTIPVQAAKGLIVGSFVLWQSLKTCSLSFGILINFTPNAKWAVTSSPWLLAVYRGLYYPVI